jgi:hypothetical protein
MPSIVACQAPVAWYRDAVADFRDQCRIFKAAVQVHHESRIARQHRGCIQVLAEVCDQPVCADVAGDMLVEHCLIESESSQ